MIVVERLRFRERWVDWLAAGTFDRAVGLSLFTLQVTHRIDADTDIERDHIVATVQELPGVAVDVIRDFSTGYHANLAAVAAPGWSPRW